ncbi:hypothetical protein EX30DRAFT_202339 [Ascodesmis nigricans]|uniref:Uncharacterized protein n=1 Tax=Ascodesmis nigricans TaxID=341454 RepID=A0A4S2MRC9_9PEZI|nr:hypothetical protein EX30DRAFT_202339 [Ascodesmis nigricans]
MKNTAPSVSLMKICLLFRGQILVLVEVTVLDFPLHRSVTMNRRLGSGPRIYTRTLHPKSHKAHQQPLSHFHLMNSLRLSSQRLAEEREATEKKQEDAEKKCKETEAAAQAEQPPLNRAEAATHWRRPEQPKFTPPSPLTQQPQPPPVWSSDKVRNAFNEDMRPSTSTSTPLPPSFPRSSQQSFSSDTQVPRPASTPDASFITDTSRPSFLPPSDPSTSPSPHPMAGVPSRPPLSVYPHHSAPLRGAYPQFPDQMHTISPAPIGPGNMAGAYTTNVHPAQSPPQWPRQPGNQYGAIGERTNREQPDSGHVNEMNPSYGRGQSNAVSGMPQSYGRGHMYQANQRFVGDHFNHVGSPHQFNADNRGGYGGFNVHQASHQQHYRNQQGIPTPLTLNSHAPDHHDPFYPGPPRQGRRPSASPNMNNTNLYRGPGRRSPFQGPSGHSPNLGNANLYQQYGRGRRSPSFQGGGMSPNLNHAHMYAGNRQGRPHIPVYNHQDMRSPEPANAPSVVPSIPEHPPSAPGHEHVPSLQSDFTRDCPVRISPGDQQNAKMLAESNPAAISAWGNYNALEDDALRAAQASVDGAHELNAAEPSTGPAIKQTIIFRHRQEKQTDAQADAEVAAWAARRGKAPVAIPEHFKPGYTPPTRDGVASSLPPHLKAKMESQQLGHPSPPPSIASPQSPPPPISDDHPVHGDHLPRVHLPGQHDRRTTTGIPMSQCDRISSVQDMLLSVMSQHRAAPAEPPHPTITVTVSLPPSTCDDSPENNDTGKDSTTLSSSMPGAEEFQESLNHQPFGSTPTIRLPVNMEYPKLLAPSDSPVAKKPPPRAPKADSIRPFELKYHPPFVVVVSVPGMGDNKKEIPWKPKLTPRGNRNGSGRGGGGWRVAKRTESSGPRSDTPTERLRGRGRRGRGRGSPQIGDGPSKTSITA